MTAVFTQISQRSGTVSRVPRGQTPVVELYLEEGQYIAGFELSADRHPRPDRKTVDWHWTAAVVTPLSFPG
jgi:hypothetical protein